MRGTFENVGARTAAELLVLLDVDVDSQHPHHFSHNEGKASKVKGPTIGVLPFLILILLRRNVPQRSRDVDNHTNYVAQTCDSTEIRYL